MSELHDIIERYSTLIEAMDQLEKEVPVIEKIYAELKDVIKDQSNSAKTSIKEIKYETDKLLLTVEEKQKSIMKLTTRYDSMEKLMAESETRVQALLITVNSRIDTLNELLSKGKNEKANYKKLEERIDAIEKKIAAEIVSTDKKKAIKGNASEQGKKLNLDLFPSNAESFTFDEIRSVKHRKPCGIVLDGQHVIMAEHWTDLLKAVVPSMIDEYEISVDDLCSAGYGIGDLPYFIKGKKAPYGYSADYKYISEHNLLVYSGGSDITVNLIYNLLCDYLDITPGDIELFYRNKY